MLMRSLRLCLTGALWMGLAACTSLLPRGSTENLSGFTSFEAARSAIEQVKPYETTTD